MQIQERGKVGSSLEGVRGKARVLSFCSTTGGNFFSKKNSKGVLMERFSLKMAESYGVVLDRVFRESGNQNREKTHISRQSI